MKGTLAEGSLVYRKLKIMFHGEHPKVVMDTILKTVNNIFNLEIRVVPLSQKITGIINRAYVSWRDQFNASEILNNLARIEEPLILLVIASNIFVPGLNFVFGVAYPGFGTVISTYMLRSDNLGLMLKRIEKTVKHELGHVFGLRHCRNECVMRFANSVYELDLKPENFCFSCAEKLRRIGVLNF